MAGAMPAPKLRTNPPAEPLRLVDDPDIAAGLMHPVRRRVLGALVEGDSASGVARRLGESRQRVNYHLRELERAGFVEQIEERRKGNCVERIVRATARAFLVDPDAIGALGATPDDARDNFSAAHLITGAARTVRDVARARQRASEEGKRLATFSLETEVAFATAAARNAFVEELATAVGAIIARHHAAVAPRSRNFRLFLGIHPSMRESDASAKERHTDQLAEQRNDEE